MLTESLKTPQLKELTVESTKTPGEAEVTWEITGSDDAEYENVTGVNISWRKKSSKDVKKITAAGSLFSVQMKSFFKSLLWLTLELRRYFSSGETLYFSL